MDRLRKDLETLKSWGIESIPVDKVLSMIKGEEVTFRFPSDLTPVGGTIFYIDDTVDGVYEFFDAYGNVIDDVALIEVLENVSEQEVANVCKKQLKVDKVYMVSRNSKTDVVKRLAKIIRMDV